MLDLLDGKHARNTSTASPMGLLIDHGCDAFTTFLFTMSMGSILKLKGPYWYSIIWFLASVPFYFNTLEEYHTGCLELPFFHGVSEGTLISFLVCIFTASVGQPFWLSRVVVFENEFSYGEVFVGSVFIFSMTAFVLSSGLKTIFNVKTGGLGNFLLTSVAFILLVALQMLVIIYSQSELVKSKPKLVIYVFGFVFARLVGLLQLAHISSGKFQQFTPCLLFFLSILGSGIVLEMLEIGLVVDYLLLFFLAFNFLSWFHYAYYVSEALCEFLDIYRFSIKKKQLKNE